MFLFVAPFFLDILEVCFVTTTIFRCREECFFSPALRSRSPLLSDGLDHKPEPRLCRHRHLVFSSQSSPPPLQYDQVYLHRVKNAICLFFCCFFSSDLSYETAFLRRKLIFHPNHSEFIPQLHSALEAELPTSVIHSGSTFYQVFGSTT